MGRGRRTLPGHRSGSLTRRTQGAARSGRQKEVLRPRTRAGLVEVDRLEALLIEAARARRSLTYAQVLAHFGIKITPRRVYALCRDLGQVCERNRARGEPELAVLVVRKSDRLPGEGFFHGAWRDGSYDGPATGPRARAYIDRLSALAFAFWAERVAGSAPAGAQSRR